jgi:TMEM175 potassium channel family protein
MLERDLGRVVAFSDGVMAVAITLLVLNIEVPVRSRDLPEDLVDLLPSLGVYLLSFALIGRYWVIHHNLFERLRGFDSVVMWLNLTFLALIALMPFSTDLYDRYTDDGLAAAVFGANIALTALTHWAMNAHVLRHRLVLEEHRAEREEGRPVGLGLTAVFLLAVPAAFVNVHLAEALWISTIVLRYPLRRLGRRTSSA